MKKSKIDHKMLFSNALFLVQVNLNDKKQDFGVSFGSF